MGKSVVVNRRSGMEDHSFHCACLTSGRLEQAAGENMWPVKAQKPVSYKPQSFENITEVV